MTLLTKVEQDNTTQVESKARARHDFKQSKTHLQTRQVMYAIELGNFHKTFKLHINFGTWNAQASWVYRMHLKGSKYVQIEWYYGKKLVENYKDLTLLLGLKSLPPRPFDKHGCVTFLSGSVPIVIRMQVILILNSTTMKI